MQNADSTSIPSDVEKYFDRIKARTPIDAQTADEIAKRRECVRHIIEIFESKNLNWKKTWIGKPLLQMGFKSSRNTIDGDVIACQRENTWVLDLGRTYSAKQASIEQKLQFIYGEAEKQYQKDWKVTKAVRKTTPKGAIVEAHTSSEIPAAKNMFLMTMLRTIELLKEHSNGANVNRAAALLSQELADADKQIEELKSRQIQKEATIEQENRTHSV